MQIFDFEYKKNDSLGCVLALGNFDGVHAGHLHLLTEAREYAEKCKKQFGIYTFLDSPKFKNPVHSLLTTVEMRQAIFENDVHCDFVYLESFDKVKNLSPAQFVEYLIEKFDCECVFCGDNFSFGRGASGNAVQLQQLMQYENKECVIVDGLCLDGEIVSSTRIIGLIKNGYTDAARRLLSRPYSFTSPVLHGKTLGHKLGFPTINQIMPEELACPSFGVYASLVDVDEKRYIGVTNFGIKPTVTDAGAPIAETHIIDFDGDIYGKQVTLSFYKKIRDEKKFSSLDELKIEISRNAAQAVRYFKENYEKS